MLAFTGYPVFLNVLFSGRIGYNYHFTEIEQDANLMLPSELFDGYVLGSSIAINFDPLYIDIGFEWLSSNSLLQSKGLHDGEAVGINGKLYSVSLQYAWKQSIKFVLRYALNVESYNFSGVSEPNSGITQATRNDTLFSKI